MQEKEKGKEKEKEEDSTAVEKEKTEKKDVDENKKETEPDMEMLDNPSRVMQAQVCETTILDKIIWDTVRFCLIIRATKYNVPPTPSQC